MAKASSFEGTVDKINIKGQLDEASHQCLFNMRGDSTKTALRLNPFTDAVKYRQLLGVLLAAAIGRSVTTATFEPSDDSAPLVFRLVADQVEGAMKAKRRSVPASEVWDFIGLVDRLHAGTNMGDKPRRSGFTLKAAKGKASADFVLDSLKAPKRSAAMLLLVATAFGAGVPVRVNAKGAAKGKRLAIEIEIEL